MAATAEGNTSTRPHCRAWPSAVGVFEPMESPWYNSVALSGTATPARISSSVNSNRKVAHGQALRDLRQRAAIRTPRQSRQEPGQPEVPAQPPDGPRDGGRPPCAGADVHPLSSHLLGLGEH